MFVISKPPFTCFPLQIQRSSYNQLVLDTNSTDEAIKLSDRCIGHQLLNSESMAWGSFILFTPSNYF